MDTILKEGVWTRSQVRERRLKPKIPGDTNVKYWGAGGRMGTVKGTREKKNLGQGENQQSEVPQELRKENSLSLEHGKADALGKAETEDRGQDFQISLVHRGRASVERRWQRTD